MKHHGVNLPFQTILGGSTVTATDSLPVFFTNPGAATLAGLTIEPSRGWRETITRLPLQVLLIPSSL
jgi:hypothetical protein